MTNDLDDLRERMLELADEGLRSPVAAAHERPPRGLHVTLLRAAVVLTLMVAAGLSWSSLRGVGGGGQTSLRVHPTVGVPPTDPGPSPGSATAHPPTTTTTSEGTGQASSVSRRVWSLDLGASSDLALQGSSAEKARDWGWHAIGPSGVEAIIRVRVADSQPTGRSFSTPGGTSGVLVEIQGLTSLAWSSRDFIITLTFLDEDPRAGFGLVERLRVGDDGQLVADPDVELSPLSNVGGGPMLTYCAPDGGRVFVLTMTGVGHVAQLIGSLQFSTGLRPVDGRKDAWSARREAGGGTTSGAALRVDADLVLIVSMQAPEASELLASLTSREIYWPVTDSEECGRDSTAPTSPPTGLLVAQTAAMEHLPTVRPCDASVPAQSGALSTSSSSSALEAARRFAASETFSSLFGVGEQTGWWRYDVSDVLVGWGWNAGDETLSDSVAVLFITEKTEDGWSVTRWQSSGC